uniref:Uncharacterized protein n=1 Tax=Oxyrrhis marina TaxID=2969 RepID=A0A6U9L086_OXYMA|mmetsp:Transcript_18360/g.44236  ORF Transcript_18360/g.44236 Transcript_18360/m.44236 type:complete len:125 (+) Transcript_18360:52-426(+)
MINFIPKAHPSVSLLYGKRSVQRIIVGSRQQEIEIPTAVTSKILDAVDTSASYIGNKYNALPWKDFIEIKIDAHNLIEADVKTALTSLDWFGKVRALYTGQATMTECDVALRTAGGAFKYPVAK